MASTETILIGTAGYSYPGPPPKGWYGAFYPDRKPKVDELKYYSSIFNTVEINSTFYRPASQIITKNWVAKTPSDFSFAIKLWQKFTHPKKIGRKDIDEEWKRITKVRAGLEPLADARKLGALLLQYPAGFHFTLENADFPISAPFPSAVDATSATPYRLRFSRSTATSLLVSSRPSALGHRIVNICS